MTTPPDDLAPTILAHLRAAAELADRGGVGRDQFMHAAWRAFLDSHPALREELAARELEGQLANLRERGLIGQA